MNSTASRSCWCGNSNLKPFGPSYGVCETCGTLVSLCGLTSEQTLVNDDESDFYGKQYWLDHQSKDLGLPDIYARSRHDITERNLHWLRTLLRYRTPPARSLELGSGHGSFVALMKQAGYDASGVEMSPWVVEFSRRTFNVSVFVGPVEQLEVPPRSIDVIILMDVLEHLSDPVATMTRCLQLLSPGGIFLVQTPMFKEGIEYSALVEANDAFLEMLQEDEHLYLFSQRSVKCLLERIGVGYTEFERAIFSRYDMFFAASPEPLIRNSDSQIERCLLETPAGRLALALLDLRNREEEANRRVAELGGTSRGGDLQFPPVQSALSEQIETLTGWLKESEADRGALSQQIRTLTAWLKESEADRIALNDQIQILNPLLKELQEDRVTQHERIAYLESRVRELARDTSEARANITSLLSHISFRLVNKVVRWNETVALWDWLQRRK